ENLKLAVGVGIGFFIAFIGLKNAGIIVADETTFVAIGDLTTPTVLLAVFGLVVSIILLTLKFQGGIFYGMLLTVVAGMLTGLIQPPTRIGDVIGSVPSLAPTFGQALFNFDHIFTVQMLLVIWTFLFVDF